MRAILPALLAGLLASPALAQGDLPPSTATATPAPAAMVWYFDRALTDADLQGRSLRELSLLRNTIFARAGNPFRKDWLNAWFRAQPWYTPAKTWDPAKITPIDWENAKTIAAYESSLKRAELEAHYVLETDAGDRIYVHNTAIRHATPEVTARLMRGEPVDPADVYFRCLPRLETGSAALGWINDRLFVGGGVRRPAAVELQFFLLA